MRKMFLCLVILILIIFVNLFNLYVRLDNKEEEKEEKETPSVYMPLNIQRQYIPFSTHKDENNMILFSDGPSELTSTQLFLKHTTASSYIFRMMKQEKFENSILINHMGEDYYIAHKPITNLQLVTYLNDNKYVTKGIFSPNSPISMQNGNYDILFDAEDEPALVLLSSQPYIIKYLDTFNAILPCNILLSLIPITSQSNILPINYTYHMTDDNIQRDIMLEHLCIQFSRFPAYQPQTIVLLNNKLTKKETQQLYQYVGIHNYNVEFQRIVTSMIQEANKNKNSLLFNTWFGYYWNDHKTMNEFVMAQLNLLRSYDLALALDWIQKIIIDIKWDNINYDMLAGPRFGILTWNPQALKTILILRPPTNIIQDIIRYLYIVPYNEQFETIINMLYNQNVLPYDHYIMLKSALLNDQPLFEAFFEKHADQMRHRSIYANMLYAYMIRPLSSHPSWLINEIRHYLDSNHQHNYNKILQLYVDSDQSIVYNLYHQNCYIINNHQYVNLDSYDIVNLHIDDANIGKLVANVTNTTITNSHINKLKINTVNFRIRNSHVQEMHTSIIHGASIENMSGTLNIVANTVSLIGSLINVKLDIVAEQCNIHISEYPLTGVINVKRINFYNLETNDITYSNTSDVYLFNNIYDNNIDFNILTQFNENTIMYMQKSDNYQFEKLKMFLESNNFQVKVF